jgi:hypothetical protein
VGAGPNVGFGLGCSRGERGIVEEAEDGGRGTIRAEVCIPEEGRRVYLGSRGC